MHRTSSSLAIACSLLLFAILSGCGKESYGDFTSGMHGVVLDDISDLPIDSAWACVRDTTEEMIRFYSDSSGFFEIWDWGTPAVDIFVGKAGYSTEKRHIQLRRTVTDTVVFRLHNQDSYEIE